MKSNKSIKRIFGQLLLASCVGFSLLVVMNSCQKGAEKESETKKEDSRSSRKDTERRKKATGGMIFLLEVSAPERLQELADSSSIEYIQEECQTVMAEVAKVLRQRLENFGVEDFNIEILEGGGLNGNILVEVPKEKNPERLRKLLQSSGNLEFCQIYAIDEIYNSLQTAFQIEVLVDTTKTTLLQYLKHTLNPWSYVIGYAKGSDREKVDFILANEKVQAALPKNLRFGWSAKPESDDNYALYAINLTNGTPVLTGEIISDVKTDFDQFSNPVVLFSMTPQGGQAWADFTRKNIGKAVAIVIDGVVYSAPLIQSEITGGQCQISGNFTIEDTKDLVNILKSEKLPASVRIIQEEIIE